MSRNAIVNVSALGGVALLVSGVWEIHPSSAMIVLGVILLAVAVIGGRR